MQSVEYTIKDHKPYGHGNIHSISNINPSEFWESDDHSASLYLEFDPCTISEILINTDTSVSIHIIGLNSKLINSSIQDLNNASGLTMFEGSSQSISKKFKILKVATKQKFCACVAHISSESENLLKIYSFILKTSRDTDDEQPKSKSISNTFTKSQFFYSPNTNGEKKLNHAISPASAPVNKFKQTSLNIVKKTGLDTDSNNLSKMMESHEFVEDQKRMLENCQNTNSIRQKTLRSATSKQKVPTCSYSNLLAPNAERNYVICCKDEGKMKDCIEEMCKVLGVCYFEDLEEGVSHVIYEGNDPEVIFLVNAVDAKIVSRRWLMDCIRRREPLLPEMYRRYL